MVGDFEPKWYSGGDKVSEEQLYSLIVLVKILKAAYGIDAVKGHRDYNDSMPNTTTVCPGDNLYNTLKSVGVIN